MPGAEPDRAVEQIEHLIGLETHNAVFTSAKTGAGVHEVLEAIVRDVPAPKGDPEAPLKALIFDSWYDSYRGVIVLFRVIDGTIRGMKIRFFIPDAIIRLKRWVLIVRGRRRSTIESGRSRLLNGIDQGVADVQIGDTITECASAWNRFLASKRLSRWSSPTSIRLTLISMKSFAMR